MSLRFERDSNGDRRSRLDNMFWRDLSYYLRENNTNARLAPPVGMLLSPVEQRSLQIAYRAVKLTDSGVDPREARRQAFNEFYPPQITE